MASTASHPTITKEATAPAVILAFSFALYGRIQRLGCGPRTRQVASAGHRRCNSITLASKRVWAARLAAILLSYRERSSRVQHAFEIGNT